MGLQGHHHTPEAREKMRRAKLGTKHTAQALANMGEAQRARPRAPEEYASRRGRTRPADVVARSAKARTGVKRTPEQRARMVAAALAMTPEKRAKIAQARRDAIARRMA